MKNHKSHKSSQMEFEGLIINLKCPFVPFVVQKINADICTRILGRHGS